MTDKEMGELHQKVIAACNSIGDHFETIQILASVTEEGETYRVEHGIGNKFARVEQCRAYADCCQEIDRQNTVDDFMDSKYGSDEADEEDEDNEGWKKQ